MKKLNWLAAIGLSIGMTGYSQAAMITYGGVAASDGSGLTSTYMDPLDATLNTAGQDGYFIETFDVLTQMFGFGSGSTSFNQNPAVNCALNSSAAGIVVTGSFGIGSTDVGGGRAAPAGDGTCFGYTPALGGSANGSVKIDYSAFLAQFSSALKINYLGFYWGSADIYNTLKFYNGVTLVAEFTGTQLLGANGGTSGNQTAPGSNVYVNISFADFEVFDSLELVSTGRAFEVDNIVIGTKQVPAPAGIVLLAIGLLGIRIFGKK